MNRTFVVAGISTEVGKTVVSALLAEALKADYWKPIQSGNIEDADKKTVQQLISNSTTKCHPEDYLLKEPISPHAAAEKDNVQIELEKIVIPKTDNTLIIELAGGIMVPLNNNTLNLDLLKQWKLPVFLVANYYLGSINHTLMSIEILKQYNIPIFSLVFNGDTVVSSRDIILKYSGIKNYIEIPQIHSINKQRIKEHAKRITIKL